MLSAIYKGLPQRQQLHHINPAALPPGTVRHLLHEFSSVSHRASLSLRTHLSTVAQAANTDQLGQPTQGDLESCPFSGWYT